MTGVMFKMSVYITKLYIYCLSVSVLILPVYLDEQCTSETCSLNGERASMDNMYSEGANKNFLFYMGKIDDALALYEPCDEKSCNCHLTTLKNDLEPFQKTGISKAMFDSIRQKGTKYQIIAGKLYRQSDCLFPARCSGVEYFLLKVIKNIPDLEVIINTRDWPQLNKKWGSPLAPILSFSKTNDYWDIMYPAWSFWEGGPAIKLYPTGLGKWDHHRKSLTDAADKWPWDQKISIAFFRGSRTSDERDPIVLLSRSHPELVDAQYTKNQAWKSDKDTLNAPPAEEISLEDHCQYKFLFNYRGVAASFRFKHLFLCKSLVFHVGDEWLEFFYPSLKPWVHYIPVAANASENDLKDMIEFFQSNDAVAQEIAKRGFQQIWDHLKISDVKCYWKKLLKGYAKMLKYDVVKDESLKEITTASK